MVVMWSSQVLTGFIVLISFLPFCPHHLHHLHHLKLSNQLCHKHQSESNMVSASCTAENSLQSSAWNLIILIYLVFLMKIHSLIYYFTVVLVFTVRQKRIKKKLKVLLKICLLNVYTRRYYCIQSSSSIESTFIHSFYLHSGDLNTGVTTP
jgi:hypothetical protein